MIVFSIDFGFTQVDECGTRPPTLSEKQASISLGNSGLPTASALTTEYDIPIHVYILKDGLGNEASEYGLTIEDFAIKLEEANQYFTNGISFYICQVDDIVSDIPNEDWLNMTLGDDLNISTLTNHSYDNNAVSIYIVRKIIGTGYWDYDESAMGLIAHASSFTIAHELGHTLGLFHTFSDAVLRPIPGFSTDPCVQLLPDNNCANNCVFTCSFPACGQNDIISEGKCNGDFISDTGVDPTYYTVGDGGGIATNFCSVDVIPCTLNVNGVDEYYDVPYKNMMSYVAIPLRDHFSDGQLDKMMMVLLAGDKHYLIDDNEPICESYTFDTDIFVSETGIIEAVKKDENGEYIFLPLPDQWINIKKIDNSSCQRASNNDGVYELMESPCDNFIPQYLDDVNIELGSCENYPCPQLSVTNGLSTADIIGIRKHILGLADLDKPYAWIAADLNNSGTISTYDYLKLTKVILGINEDFSDVPSWRFLPIYALDQQWGFQSDFNDNPFNAVWNINGEQRHYLSDGVSKSYLDKINLNLLNPDVTQENTWSFRGVKSGDVNFTADIENPENIPDAPHPLVTSLSHECIPAGQKFKLKFKTNGNNWQDTEGYQIGMRIISGKATIAGIGAGDLSWFSLDNFNKEKISLGEIRTLWYSRNGTSEDLSGGKILFELDMVANEAICDISSVFEFDNSWLSNEIYDSLEELKGIDLQLEVVGEVRINKLKSVYPNTYSDMVSFEFKLEVPETVNIRLWDQYGNIHEEETQFVQGEHVYQIINTNALQTGVISYRILLGNEEHTGNLIKM